MMNDDPSNPALAEQNRLLSNRLEELERDMEDLRHLQWLIRDSGSHESLGTKATNYAGQEYGDLVQLNTSRVIVDSVGPELLKQIADDYLELLGTSSAVYEENGDYALGIFSSGWCRFMDQASRRLYDSTDNAAALRSGNWHCHESCWECSQHSIQTGQPTDIECKGGIRLYAVPVIAGNRVIGSINFGYGDPPREAQKLQELAERYGVDVESLRRHAASYNSRPRFIIELAKRRLQSAAKLIGEIVARKCAEQDLSQKSAELEHANKRLQALSERIIEIQEEERCNLARELHDEIGQVLTAISISLKSEQTKRVESGPSSLDEGISLVDRAIGQVRNLSLELRPTILDDLGLTAALRWCLERQAGQAGFEASFTSSLASEPPFSVKNACYRIVQEALTNVARYAHARRVRVEVQGDVETIHLLVQDDGTGFDLGSARRRAAEGKSMGLFNMEERAQLLGGECVIETAPGQGTTITVHIPVGSPMHLGESHG